MTNITRNPKGGDISPIDDLIFWSAVCDEVMVVKPSYDFFCFLKQLEN